MRRVLVISSLIILLLLASASAISRSNSDCSSCHYSESGSAGYEYKAPTVLISVPMFVEPGEEFDISDKEMFADYDLRSLTIELFQEPILLSLERTTEDRGYVGKTEEFNFPARARGEGFTEVRVVVTAGVFYDHNSGSGNDHRKEVTEKYAVINVGSTSLKPTAWSLILGEGGDEIVLSALKPVANVSVYAPYGISAEPDFTPEMEAGESLRITIVPTGSEQVDSNVIVSWKENNTPFSMPIHVLYESPKERDSDAFRLAGRISGLATVAILLISVILGGLWNTRGYLNRRVGARTRVAFHCGVSWFLVALSLYHGLVLALGPYFRQLTDMWIVVGYVAATAMLVAGLSGGLQRSLTRWMGARNWRWLHLYSTLGALTLGIMHGIRIGTDLAFIRKSSVGTSIAPIILIILIVSAVILRPGTGKKKEREREQGKIQGDGDVGTGENENDEGMVQYFIEDNGYGKWSDSDGREGGVDRRREDEMEWRSREEQDGESGEEYYFTERTQGHWTDEWDDGNAEEQYFDERKQEQWDDEWGDGDAEVEYFDESKQDPWDGKWGDGTVEDHYFDEREREKTQVRQRKVVRRVVRKRIVKRR